MDLDTVTVWRNSQVVARHARVWAENRHLQGSRPAVALAIERQGLGGPSGPTAPKPATWVFVRYDLLDIFSSRRSDAPGSWRI